MSTYDYEKILSDYANDRMSVEMTLGHALQHIGKLYAAQSASQRDLQEKLATLTETSKHLRADIERLIAHTALPLHAKDKPPRKTS